MAKIKKIKEGTATVYPATIPQAVIDPTSGKSVRTELNEKTVTSELNKVYPLYNYNVRVGTDSGSIGNIEELAKLYNENLALLDSTVFLWSGVSGMKTRTSGSNVFASKLYNMANKVQQFGANLVTNGTFTGADGSTPAGWASVNSAVLATDSNRLKVTVGTVFGGASQIVTTIIGKRYHFTATYIRGNADARMAVGTTITGRELCDTGTLTADRTVTLSFVATSTTSYIYISNASANLGDYCFFDNISVQQMDWIEGTNDAVQTAEANQPYVGGVIAGNEVRKIKSLSISEDKKLNFSNIVFSESDNWSVSFIVKLLDIGTQIILGQSSNFGYIGLTSSAVRILSYYGVVTSFSNTHSSLEIGKTLLYTITHRNGNFSLYKEGKLISSLSGVGGISFNQLLIAGTSGNDLIGELSHAQIHNRALSASEIQAQHDYLRLQIPEIEGIAIGNQYWQTSNYEGVVAGDGSVIPEVQNSDNVELITNAADRDFSSDTGWWIKGAGVTIADGVCHITSQATNINAIKRDISSLANKRFKITFTILNYVSGYLSLSNTSNSSTQYNSNGTYTVYGIAAYNQIALFAAAGTQLDIDNISFEEIGWSQSTALYDAIYAQTSGTTAVKELAALKAAAMWCYYNNDVNNGAIYGKLYNWYAVKLISLYPPTGYRVPSSDDFTQLQNYLGGSSVAGGKMKKDGLTYWASPNTGAANESGFSSIGAGYRNYDNGAFSSIGTHNYLWDTQKGSFTILSLYPSTSSTVRTGRESYGFSLRLISNSPVGPNERTITSTTIVSDITSTANSTQIPFGYSVASIRLKTTANLTNIKVELWNNYSNGLSPALVATLITGKSANNTTMVFPVLADAPALLQDGTLRITATGANTFETVVEYNLQKNTF